MKYTDREHYDGTKDWKNYYWFYYKWHILGGLFLAVVIAICTAQCATKANPDTYVIFYSDIYVMDQALEEITDELSQYGKDTNGDEKVEIQAINCTYSLAQPETKGPANQRAIMQMHSTDAPIWIMDEAGVKTFVEESDMDLFVKLDGEPYFLEASKITASEALSHLVEESGREYYIYFRNTEDKEASEMAMDMMIDLVQKSAK